MRRPPAGGEGGAVAGELLRRSACELRRLLAAGEISPLDLVEASAARIAEVEPHLNALPTQCTDRAREHAKKLSSARTLLGGIPTAVKDLSEVRGVRSTFGSAVYKNHTAARSDVMVERIESNGAIVMGKSNTPEFGAGASTFNDVFGVTRNPWDTARSVAGSSGGSCAAVAAGECWLATGSDLGGSLRTPAAFNAVVGLRPTPGRVPRDNNGGDVFNSLSVNGPIARNVADAALLLDAMAGAHPADPLAMAAPAESFLHAAERETVALGPAAFSADLGVTVTDAEVAAVCRRAALLLAEAGVAVEERCPDFTGAEECFQVLRAKLFAAELGDVLKLHRQKLKPELVWNIEKGLALSAAEIVTAENQRARIARRMGKFFQRHDFLLCPAAIVAPFPAEARFVEEVNGVRFDNYVQWINITSVISLTGCPAISVPAGFSAGGLPIGLQIIAAPHQEAKLLRAAKEIEQRAGVAEKIPLLKVNVNH